MEEKGLTENDKRFLLYCPSWYSLEGFLRSIVISKVVEDISFNNNPFGFLEAREKEGL